MSLLDALKRAVGAQAVVPVAVYDETPPTYEDGDARPLRATNTGALLVALDGSGPGGPAATVGQGPATTTPALQAWYVKVVDAAGLAVDLAGLAKDLTVQAVRDRLPATFTAGGGVKTGLVDALPAGTNTIGQVDQGIGGVSAWKVDGSGVTQPVSAAALPLPTNAAQESGGNLATLVSTLQARLPASLTNGGGVRVEPGYQNDDAYARTVSIQPSVLAAASFFNSLSPEQVGVSIAGGGTWTFDITNPMFPHGRIGLTGASGDSVTVAMHYGVHPLPGFSVEPLSVFRFGPSHANTIYEVGIQHSTFGILLREQGGDVWLVIQDPVAPGGETAIPRAFWSDPLDGTGASGVNYSDFSTGMYQFLMRLVGTTQYGATMRIGAETIFRATSQSQHIPASLPPIARVIARARNVGPAVPTTMLLRSLAANANATVDQSTRPFTVFRGTDVTVSTTGGPVIAIRVRNEIGGVLNLLSIFPRSITVRANSGAITFTVYKVGDPTSTVLTGGSWANDGTVVEYNITATAFTPGAGARAIAFVQISTGTTYTFDLTTFSENNGDMLRSRFPNNDREMLVVFAQAQLGSSSCTASITGREQGSV